MSRYLILVDFQLMGTEARLARLEQCDCQKSCYSNGTVHADGATWQRDCNRCSCVVSSSREIMIEQCCKIFMWKPLWKFLTHILQHGEITCRPVECDRAECKNPVLHPGECCPTCLSKFLDIFLFIISLLKN